MLGPPRLITEPITPLSSPIILQPPCNGWQIATSANQALTTNKALLKHQATRTLEICAYAPHAVYVRRLDHVTVTGGIFEKQPSGPAGMEAGSRGSIHRYRRLVVTFLSATSGVSERPHRLFLR